MKPVFLVLSLLPLAAGQDRVDPSFSIKDVQGRLQRPFDAQAKAASIVFFITNDCPISNRYAREIQRTCSDYGDRARCFLDYVDPDLTATEVLKHMSEFGYAGISAILDTRQAVVKASGATVTPETAVIAAGGKLAYRGRIDNTYLTFGQARRQPTERDLRLALDAVLQGKPVAAARTKPIGCYIPPLDLKK